MNDRLVDWLLILVPLGAAVLACAWRSERSRPWLLPAAGLAHAVLSFQALLRPRTVPPGAWFGTDAVALAVLPVVALLFLVCALYGLSYLRLRAERRNRVFVTAMLGMLGFLSLALQSRHMGLLWVAAEGATLATVPLLHFNGTARALEATWKYLLVGGSGIALSLLGTFCLGYAALLGNGTGDLTFSALALQGTALSRPWLLTAWVLLLTGYGTKIGLAPMHTWKPDAYGEAPGIVGAMLAGGMTTMALVALLRVQQVMRAAGAGAAASRTLLALGLFSMAVAALFLLGTRDFKRMLAYSSVEHMGILSVGAAIGGAGLWAALFHVWSHSLTKGSLFLSVGNVRRAAGARTADEVSGMAVVAPASARILVAGMLAVTALPPFGPFFSELGLVRAAIEAGHWAATALFLACLLLAFMGMTRLVFAVVDGRPRIATRRTPEMLRERVGLILPPLGLLGLSLWLGLATPAPLREAWTRAVLLLSRP
jgi:hydrogenase-4 component F